MVQKIFHNSSLPRAGSTIIQNILAQNPEIYPTPTSGVFELLNGVRTVYSNSQEFKDQDKTFLRLAEAKIIDEFSKIKDDFTKTKQAALMLEIIDQLVVDAYHHQEIYQELIAALHSNQLEMASLSFALKILKPLGYPLDLNADGRKINGVNIENGGLIYQNESGIIDLDVNVAVYC